MSTATHKKNELDKRAEKLKGSFRIRNGNFEYRLTVAKGLRKSFSLGTQDWEEAIVQAELLDAQFEAPSKQAAMEKMAAIMGYSKVAENLRLDEAWSVYSVHPGRAMPATVHEQISYHTTYDEFVKFVETPSIEADATRHNAVFLVKEITPKM